MRVCACYYLRRGFKAKEPYVFQEELYDGHVVEKGGAVERRHHEHVSCLYGFLEPLRLQVAHHLYHVQTALGTREM